MTQDNPTLVDSLTLGVIQTTLNSKLAWSAASGEPKIAAGEDNRAWHEIRRAMRALADHDDQPRIVLLPELALPRTRLDDFEQLVCSMNAIAIVGVDYRLDHVKKSAKNEGLVIVPRNFWKRIPSRNAARVWFGKRDPAPAEASDLAKYIPPWTFDADPNVYVFDAGPYGRIGVSICYDFMDIERALLYRGRVHHLFVIAYNRDVKLFESLAVSLSRTIFCNVVVCNTGYFGGSLVVTPYYDAFKRIGYSVDGGQLFTAQCVSLPVRDLDAAIHGSDTKPKATYKHLPPGFMASIAPTSASPEGPSPVTMRLFTAE
ncbi:carbon-nitrogen hydrolase family protein [Pelomonas sp. BJYL3]|uniref:carbon-nitrogen hydrolase family protein n=1 Tax=Pelomonas sp. BJYL3 TaxID=2976697 RepID=UPI0022B4BC63|nr:carbon-nitrogen hydrolase family protein [Pelomonas sp. BJYL3]